MCMYGKFNLKKLGFKFDRLLQKRDRLILINSKAFLKAQQSIYINVNNDTRYTSNILSARDIYHASSFVAPFRNHDNQVPISAIQSRRRIV